MLTCSTLQIAASAASRAKQSKEDQEKVLKPPFFLIFRNFPDTSALAHIHVTYTHLPCCGVMPRAVLFFANLCADLFRMFTLQIAASAASRAKQIKEDQEKVPWKAFLTSPPVWAVTVAHFCFNWGYYTLLAWLPSYFELALGLNVQDSSFLTLIPYVAMILMTPVVSGGGGGGKWG